MSLEIAFQQGTIQRLILNLRLERHFPNFRTDIQREICNQ